MLLHQQQYYFFSLPNNQSSSMPFHKVRIRDVAIKIVQNAEPGLTPDHYQVCSPNRIKEYVYINIC